MSKRWKTRITDIEADKIVGKLWGNVLRSSNRSCQQGSILQPVGHNLAYIETGIQQDISAGHLHGIEWVFVTTSNNCNMRAVRYASQSPRSKYEERYYSPNKNGSSTVSQFRLRILYMSPPPSVTPIDTKILSKWLFRLSPLSSTYNYYRLSGLKDTQLLSGAAAIWLRGCK